MKWTPVLLLLLFGLLRVPIHAGEKTETIGKVVRMDPRFDELFGQDARLEKLAGGFVWTEGPVWAPKGGYLLFSDIPNNVVMKWQPGKGVSKFVQPAGYTGGTWPRPGFVGSRDEPGTNGLRLDPQGRLVMCCHGDRVVARLDMELSPDAPAVLGAEQVKKHRSILAERYMGKRFNSPNDLVFDSQGNLYFTDPPYGLPKGADDPTREMDYCGVYRVGKDATVTLLTKELSRPNGIGLSPDEKKLYVANSDPERPVWMAFPVTASGLGHGKVFDDSSEQFKAKKPGLPDGLKLDTKGNIYATGPGGLFVFTPGGTLLGMFETGVPTGNCCWGDDGSTLYVMANHDIGRIRTKAKGLGY
jgi:gluconolactonase